MAGVLDSFLGINVEDLMANLPWIIYPGIFVWTFLEGETIVLIVGALAAEGKYAISVWWLMIVAFLGSFCGDQMYYYIGRRYGTPLLKRWPNLTSKVEWAFHMVRTHETLFILSFRFIYGVRNVSPFIIGMAGVGRLKFFILNMIAAFTWANTFAWGGYFLGRALEEWLGHHKLWVLLGFVLMLVLFGVFSALRKRSRMKALERQNAAASVEPLMTTGSAEQKTGD